MEASKALLVKTDNKLRLSGTAIKLFALGLMLLDHIHYFFEFTGAIPLWFSMLGRLSAWLFLFAAVEGFIHTSNRMKYFLRIWLMGAGMGTANYLIALFLPRGDGFSPQNNIFATLTLLLILWQGAYWLKQKRIIKGVAALLLPFALVVGFSQLPANIMPWAYLLSQTFLPLPLLAEGGLPFLLGGLVLFVFHKNRKWQTLIWAVTVLGWNLYVGIVAGLPFGIQWITYHYEWMGVFAALPMLLYNEQKGMGMKRLFYAFYPAHVYLLWGLSFAVYVWMR